MENLMIPEGYRPPLSIRETEVAIKEVKITLKGLLQRTFI